MDNIMELSNLIYDIKTKITDQQYIDIMDSLNQIQLIASDSKPQMHRLYAAVHSQYILNPDMMNEEYHDIITHFKINIRLQKQISNLVKDEEDPIQLKKEIMKHNPLIPFSSLKKVGEAIEKHNKKITELDIEDWQNMKMDHTKIDYLAIESLKLFWN
jgi:hypothetical protein